MAKAPAPSGWKRLRLPAPSSWRVVVPLSVHPCPLPQPQTRRGVEANGDNSPLTLELQTAELEDGAPLFLSSLLPVYVFFLSAVVAHPRRRGFLIVCCAPAHRSSRILQRNKKGQPLTPKISNFFSSIKKRAKRLVMNLASHPSGRKWNYNMWYANDFQSSHTHVIKKLLKSCNTGFTSL